MIRSIPGLADIATFVGMDEISQAAQPDVPLVYVNPTPSGTQLLTVSVAGTTHTVLDEPTSRQVFLRLAAGDDAAPQHAHLLDEPEMSYFYALGETPSNDFHLALDDALPWLGERLARPINDAVAGNQGATLILCGPVRALPLHAAPWIHEGAWCYLVDSVAVRYAASATMTAASLRRNVDSARRAPALLALADPRDNLPAARAEIEEVSRHFGDSVVARTGSHATFDFLQRYAGEATHIHLACHAEGGFFDAAAAGVEFADGVASIFELTQLEGVAARLIVVSACESALGSVNQLPAEAFSISTALWLAGSACAIASLWPVDDFATAMLMTRFYNELMDNELPPPEALRRAQLWLRDLDAEAEATFLKSHPDLEAEYLRRGSGAPIEHPYAHEEFWAPFIAIGA
jgi:CHAT domain-containing protein